MKMSSTNIKISAGATQANKSSYHATYVGGSNMAGWPVPPHFQMQSDATDENAKVDKIFLNDMMRVVEIFGDKK